MNISRHDLRGMTAGSLVLVQTRIPKDLHRAAKQAARKDHRTLSAFLLITLERALEERALKAPRPRHRRTGGR